MTASPSTPAGSARQPAFAYAMKAMKSAHAIWLFGVVLAVLMTPCAGQTSSQQVPLSPPVAAVHDMSQAAELLRQRDAGQATQSLQADALEQLRRIMEAMRKQQQASRQSTGQASPADGSSQQPSPADGGSQQKQGDQGSGSNNPKNGQGSGRGQKQGSGSGQPQQQGGGQRGNQGGSQSAKDSVLPGDQAAQGAAALPSELGQVEAWGFLPPDQRREVLQGMQAEPPARYRKLTERYWRVLNDSGQDGRRQ